MDSTPLPVRCGAVRCSALIGGGALGEDGQWSDEELTTLALDADPDAPLSEDAVPFDFRSDADVNLLPSWYMPPVVVGVSRRWWRPLVLLLVLSFLFIEAAGLCSSYGPLVIP